MRYFSKLEHWLVSRRITPWLSAEPLTPHGIYHLPVVFSLQKPVKKQNIKPHMKGRVQCVKSAQAETTHSTKGSRKSKKQPPWWDSETEKAWTIKGAAVRNWQKGRTRPNPDPKLKAAMDTKTEQFKQIPREAKEAKWKSFCEELGTKKRWQFYQQIKRNGRTKTTTDLEDANRSRLKTNEEKGQALLGRFIQQSNQNNLEEMKHILSDLNRRRTQRGPDDEFT